MDASELSGGEATGRAEHEYAIRVNSREKEWEEPRITFEQVVNLAYNGNPPSGPNWVFTVSYRKGGEHHPQGILDPGGSVEVRNGMVFDVTGTDKS